VSASRWSSRPRQYAAVSAGIAAVIGLVAAPWLTLELLFALVAAGVLVVGVRGLIRGPKTRTAPAKQQATKPGPRCICGDPIERWSGPGEPGWIHIPGSDTPCLDARPAYRCCVCGGPNTVYENCYGNWFCWPCADCPCGQTPCVRTGTNDPAVSAEAASCSGCTGCGGPDCIERPDRSGQDPDPTRTDPDTTGQRAADQAGHNPEALRIAANESITRALAANPDIAAEYQRIRLMLHASRDVRATLGRELDETKERLRKAERAADLLVDAHRRTERAEAARESASASAAVLLAGVVRVQQMVSAWEEQLPETIRTATAVDAIRTALATPTALGIQPTTVRAYIRGIGEKWGTRDRAEIVATARRRGVVPDQTNITKES